MGVKKKICRHQRIMFDSSPVIYFVEEHLIYGTVSDEIFKMIKDNRDVYAFSSVITLIERHSFLFIW